MESPSKKKPTPQGNEKGKERALLTHHLARTPLEHPAHRAPRHVAPQRLCGHRLALRFGVRLSPRRLLALQRGRQSGSHRRGGWLRAEADLGPTRALAHLPARGGRRLVLPSDAPRLLARAARIAHVRVLGRVRTARRRRRRRRRRVLRRHPDLVPPPACAAAVALAQLVLSAIVVRDRAKEVRRRGAHRRARLLPVGTARGGRRVRNLDVRPLARRAARALAARKVKARPALGGGRGGAGAAVLDCAHVQCPASQVGLVQPGDGGLLRVRVGKAHKGKAARLALGVDGMRRLERVAVRLDELEQVLGGGGGREADHDHLV
mmetsp:Transcript_23162/g.75666  ORF Transcript_23162/g.75666 Transcript_23162/m.75666 type:complete len:321 (+) Transcript_23162:797-1759(+)